MSRFRLHDPPLDRLKIGIAGTQDFQSSFNSAAAVNPTAPTFFALPGRQCRRILHRLPPRFLLVFRLAYTVLNTFYCAQFRHAKKSGPALNTDSNIKPFGPGPVSRNTLRQNHIIVADDSDSNFLLLERAFRKAGLPHKLHPIADGEVALAYLCGKPPFSNREIWPFPRLIILDINMPKASGFDVLMSLRSRPDLKVPSVILSASNQLEDRAMAPISSLNRPAPATWWNW
jgi:CheY-like chemotaxis protein